MHPTIERTIQYRIFDAVQDVTLLTPNFTPGIRLTDPLVRAIDKTEEVSYSVLSRVHVELCKVFPGLNLSFRVVEFNPTLQDVVNKIIEEDKKFLDTL